MENAKSPALRKSKGEAHQQPPAAKRGVRPLHHRKVQFSGLRSDVDHLSDVHA